MSRQPVIAITLDPACDTAQQYGLAARAAAAFHDRIALLGDDYLERFLAHVVASVPHYRELAASRPLSELDDFPRIDREAMRAAPASFLSDRFPIAELDRDRFWMKSNGTLAKKFKVIFDPAALYDLLYFGPALVLSSVPGLVDRLWRSDPSIPHVHSIHDVGLPAVMRNPSLGGAAVRHSVIGRDCAMDTAVIHELRRGAATVIAGSPHVLIQLVRLDESLGPAGERIRPELILASGEALYPSYRRRLAGHFGCRIIEAYAATEAGFIAADCEHGTGLHVQTDRVIVEVETGGGALVAEGAGDFLLTNLMNWAQPFVRYRLQDRGTQRWIECPCGFEGPTLTVAGREVASYDVPGAGRITSHVLAGILDRPAVEHFQVAQDPDGRLSIRWTPIAGCCPGTDGELRRALAEVLGAAFRIEACDRIAVPGGKLLRFVTAPRSSANDSPS